MSEAQSLYLYLGAFALSLSGVFCYSRTKKTVTKGKKILYWLWIAVPIIVIQGFRYEVGSDYRSYVGLYEGFSEGNSLFVSWYMNEPAFVYMCKILYTLTHGYVNAFFVADALIMNVLLFKTFDYYKEDVDMPLMYSFYYLMCFPYFLNLERQGLAVIIIWYATKYVHEKKIWRFLACVLVATMFHNTAIVGILLYFSNFIRGKYEKALRKIIIGACIIVPLLFEQLISFAASYIAIFQKYTKFLGNGQEERLNTNFIYMLVMYGVIFLLYRFIKNAPVGNYWLATLALAQLSTYLLNNYIEWGFRMSFYFEISLFYCYGYVYKKLQYRTNRILFWMFSVGMIGFYFVYKFYIQGNCDVFPYTFVWTVSDL